MNKKELVRVAAESGGLPKQTLYSHLDILIESMAKLISEGNSITISNFGTFKIIEQEERYVMNPKKGEKMLAPPKKRSHS